MLPVARAAGWAMFDAWCEGWPRAVQATLAAALDTLLAFGPEYTVRVAEDIYAVYGTCGRRRFWILAGDAIPCGRQLLPLVWGTTPATQANIDDATTEAIGKLQKWRSGLEKYQTA